MISLTLKEVSYSNKQSADRSSDSQSEPAIISGDPDFVVTGLASLANAEPSQLSFLANSQYRMQLQTTSAGAMLITPADRDSFKGSAIVVADPYLLCSTDLFVRSVCRSGKRYSFDCSYF